ncbi:MAG: hemolysin family protein [Bacteroidota bacterium]
MELLIIFILILLNGVFAMSEMSLVSSRKFKLENASRKGNKAAKTALDLSKNPTRFLSTVQIGITLIGILLGVYSGEKLTNDVIQFLSIYESLKPYASELATAILVIVITYVSILLGELLPKRIGMSFPEPIIMAVGKPMVLLARITSPFVWLLTTSNNLLLKLLNIKPISEKAATEEEIKSIIKESVEGGEIQKIEQSIMDKVFELGDRKVNTLLTPRSDIVFFTIDEPWETIKKKINKEKHSAYPVSKSRKLDDMIGIVLLKDLFIPGIENKGSLSKYAFEPIYFNENTLAYKVLETFKEQKKHYGMVVDEYGVIQGMVTMDDVMEALIGHAMKNHENVYQITQRDENSWLIDGQYSITDFEKQFDLDLKQAIDHKYTTVAGLLIFKTNGIPKIGDKIRIESYELEVVDKDGQRIDKIMMTQH